MSSCSSSSSSDYDDDDIGDIIIDAAQQGLDSAQNVVNQKVKYFKKYKVKLGKLKGKLKITRKYFRQVNLALTASRSISLACKPTSFLISHMKLSKQRQAFSWFSPEAISWLKLSIYDVINCMRVSTSIY